MSGYQLRGFVLPCSSRPTFLIPYFGQRMSNGVFAQDLTPDHRIARFLPFEPAHFDDFMGPVPVLELETGMPGLLACVDRDNRLTIGSADHMRRSLAQLQFDGAGGDAFFATEVMELRGDTAGLARAIGVAASRFSSAERGRRWMTREAGTPAIQVTGSRPVRQVSDPVELLRNAFDEADWPALFRATWATYESRTTLVELAVEWLDVVGRRSLDAGKLLLFLLPTSAKLRGERQPERMYIPAVVDAAEDWLRAYPPTAQNWATLWSRLFKYRPETKSLLVERGLQVLHDDELSGVREGARGARIVWMNIWRTLWDREDAGRAELIPPLKEHAERLLMQASFEKILLRLLDDRELRPWARHQLTNWLDASPRTSNSWAKVCTALVSRFGDDPSLIELAMDWLTREGLKLNAWRELWLRLYEFVPSSVLDETALHWLENSPYVMRNWPSVAVQLLNRGALRPTAVIIAQADRWLALQREHADRELIETFVEDQHARGPERSAGRRRVYLIYHHEGDQWRAAQVRNVLASASDMQIPRYDLAEWEELRRGGEQAISEYIDAEMRDASVAILLVGGQTSRRRWIDYEIVRSHEQGLGLFAIDVGGIPDRNGMTTMSGVNPLELWQGDVDGVRRPMSDIYRTYNWVEDDGFKNLERWVEAAAHDAERRLGRRNGAKTI